MILCSGPPLPIYWKSEYELTGPDGGSRCFIGGPQSSGEITAWGKEDVHPIEQEGKRSSVWISAILSSGSDSDDPVYHDQENDERIDNHEFGGSYIHPTYPSTIFLKKVGPLLFSPAPEISSFRSGGITEPFLRSPS
jgi:hypothetical protein